MSSDFFHSEAYEKVATLFAQLFHSEAYEKL